MLSEGGWIAWVRDAASSRLARDGAWITLSQVGIAVLTLVSVRLLTELLPPAAFGLLSLLMGMSALAVGISATPYGQALLRLHPERAGQGQLRTLRRSGGSLVLRATALMAVVLIVVGIAAAPSLGGSRWTGLSLAALVVADTVKTFELVLLNAARRQKAAALIGFADAASRPVCAGLAILALGPTAEVALAGYAIGAALVVFALRVTIKAEGAGEVQPGIAERRALSRRIGTYVMPLLPLAVFGWLSGVGDRYIVGGILGLAAVGMYSAVYGLVSKPFMITASILELTLRPFLYEAIAAQDRDRARRIQGLWLATITALSLAGAAAVVGLSQAIAWAFLAAEYRSSASIMGWIALGYALQSISNVYARLCYGYDDTRAVLVLTVAGTIVGLMASAIGAQWLGILGVAIAVPVYFAVELALAFAFGRRAERRFWATSPTHVSVAGQ